MYMAKALAVWSTVFLASCTVSEHVETPEPVVQGEASASLHMDALAEREAMYAEVFKQAERQGILLGGLRGALLGALVKGEGGAVTGAILGAIIGSAYSVNVAERLLQERDEFINRQEIIENILNASKLAADRSTEDAALVSRALTAHTTSVALIDSETHDQFADAVATVRRAVELRAVLIGEALREAELPEEEARQVRSEIARQMEALRNIQAQQKVWSALDHG
jgi:hypothetical protein